MRPSECQVSSGTGTPFNINAQFETLFSCSEEKGVVFKGLGFSHLPVNEGKTFNFVFPCIIV